MAAYQTGPRRSDMKLTAQAMLMHGMANVLGYWEEKSSDWPDGWEQWSESDREAFRAIMKREADRAARLFGFDEAWSN